VLSVIVERGGINPADLYATLSGPGAFATIDAETFKALLRGMRNTDPPLLEQAADGTLMLGEQGERLTDGHEFYAVFKTPEEYRIIAAGRTLGTISIENAFGPGDFVVFSGRRWRVLDVSDRHRTVQVESAPAGRVPRFDGGEVGALDDTFVKTIREVFTQTHVPTYVDRIAARHLAEGRDTFRQVGLIEKQIAVEDDSVFLFPWRGSATLDALRLALRSTGLPVTPASIALSVPVKEEAKLRAALEELAGASAIDGSELAEFDENLERAKYDSFIPRELLRRSAAIDRLNAAAIPEVSRDLYRSLAHL
jgi:ATP-dependent Lhr-like helicase